MVQDRTFPTEMASSRWKLMSPRSCWADKAANPVEQLLHSLVSCVTSTAVHHAAAGHIPVESVQSELVGELDLRGFLGLDPDVPKGYRSVTMRMRIAGDPTQEQKGEVMQLGCMYSPVFNSVSPGVPITVELVD
jgi:uncharacterized OsmC-like protein